MAKEPVKKRSNPVVFIVAGVIALGALGFAIKGIITPPAAANTAQMVGNVQVIHMNVSSAGYDPDFITVKQGVPVKIITNSTADAGCVRGFQMPDLGVPNKALNVGMDEIDFTPDKTGQFTFNCQMNMSKGTVNVVS